ncbi:MAG TPA: hypothetical protein VHF05_03470 [Candidatus Paceibacterota bacterium]|jgi:hypothetical protein|nr:hypothetical protein [Candidatus Paceibacterota bacterium]
MSLENYGQSKNEHLFSSWQGLENGLSELEEELKKTDPEAAEELEEIIKNFEGLRERIM